MGLKDYFVFDGVASSDFNIYASGECTFNFPEKEYESHAVPGRSGDLQVFSGRYKNITVTYPCVYKMTGNDFARDIAGFREFLMSREGYLRLEDTHHPDEFRLGIFKGGLKLNPAEYGVHGLVTTFDIEFDCMPQRWLKYGEEPVRNPFSIRNPTQFPSSPLIQIYGYGYIGINEYWIEIANKTIGDVDLFHTTRNNTSEDLTATFITDAFNTGDHAIMRGRYSVTFELSAAVAGTITAERTEQDNHIFISSLEVDNGACRVTAVFSFNTVPFNAGSVSILTQTRRIVIEYKDGNNITNTDNVDVGMDFAFSATGVTMSNPTITTAAEVDYIGGYKQVTSGTVTSTKSSLGNPLYLDMETGDAYKYEDGELIYVNDSVWIGEKLATLQPGENWFVHDNETMPTLIIIPRWWTL